MKWVFAIVFASLMLVSMVLPEKPEQNINVFSHEKLYQGPVPEGYDLDFFRKTGITKLKDEVVNG